MYQLRSRYKPVRKGLLHRLAVSLINGIDFAERALLWLVRLPNPICYLMNGLMWVRWQVIKLERKRVGIKPDSQYFTMECIKSGVPSYVYEIGKGHAKLDYKDGLVSKGPNGFFIYYEGNSYKVSKVLQDDLQDGDLGASVEFAIDHDGVVRHVRAIK